MEKKMLSSKWYATIDNESDKPVVMSKTGYWNDVVAICDSAKTAQHIAFIGRSGENAYFGFYAGIWSYGFRNNVRKRMGFGFLAGNCAFLDQCRDKAVIFG